MPKSAKRHGRTSRGGRRLLVLGTAAGLVSAGLIATSGPALSLGSSTFEIDKGSGGSLIANLNVNGGPGALDWVNAPSFRGAQDLPSGQGDNSLGQGSKDDLPDVTVGSGSIPNNKSDLTRFYIADNTAAGKQFLYLAWERANTLGTANFSFELNQAKQPDLTTPGPRHLVRTPLDVLITYDFAQGGKTPKIAVSRWLVSGNPKTLCQANSSMPCWGKLTTLSSALADASINEKNTTPASDPIVLGPNAPAPGALAPLTFGEAAINASDAGLLNPCVGFSSATVRSRSSAAFNSELKDFIAPFEVNILLPPDASGAQADSQDPTDKVVSPSPTSYNGAVALRLKDGGAAPIDLPEEVTSSKQIGPGSTNAMATQEEVTDPVTGGDIVRAQLLLESSDSTVFGTTALAQQVTEAKVLGLNVLEGTLTADVVDSVAQAYASPDLANTNSTATTFTGVAIDADGGWNPTTQPRSVTVTPGLFVPLNETVFGADSGVTFLEEEAVTTHPPLGTKAGSTGTYDATLRVAAIHVFVRDRDPLTVGDQTTDLVVSKAFAHARFTGRICTAPQEVSGNALILSASAPAALGPRPVTVGAVRIPSSGGHDHAGPLNARVPASTAPAVASVGVAETDTSGRIDNDTDDASAKSWADVASVCVAQDAVTGVCTVDAQAVRAQADAIATATSRSAAGSVEILGLRIAGTPVNVNVTAPNQRFDIPGDPAAGVTGPIGYVIVNEQFCDSGSASDCAAGSSAGITVRALHVVIPGVLDVVIGEAHADATFVLPA